MSVGVSVAALVAVEVGAPVVVGVGVAVGVGVGVGVAVLVGVGVGVVVGVGEGFAVGVGVPTAVGVGVSVTTACWETCTVTFPDSPLNPPTWIRYVLVGTPRNCTCAVVVDTLASSLHVNCVVVETSGPV